MVSGMRTLLSAVLWAAMAPLGVAPKAPSRRVTRATTANATKKSLKKAAAAPPTPSPSPRAEKVGGNRGGRKSKNKKKAKDRLPPLTDLFENQAQYPTFMKQIRNEAPTYDGINGAKISEGLDSGDRREFLQSVGQLACYASSTTLGNLGEALLIDHLKHAAALPPAAARAQPPKDLSLVHIHRRKYPAEDGYSVKWMNENGEAGLDHDAEVWQEAEDDEEKVLDVESKFSQIGYAVKNPYVVKTGERKGEKTPGYTRSSYKPLFSENEIARIEEDDGSYDVYVSAWSLRRHPQPEFEVDVQYLSQSYLNTGAPALNTGYISPNLGYPIKVNKYDVPKEHVDAIKEKYKGVVCEARLSVTCEV